MHRKSSLYSLLFAIFNDSFGWGIVLTIFAPLLFDHRNGMLSVDTSDAIRNILVGSLIGIFSLAQFIALPFLGALSDHFGRKRIMELALLGGMVSFCFSAIAISMQNLPLLFLSRFFSGIFSANEGIAGASIADMSTDSSKAKNLSLCAIAGGVSWIVAPPLGGFLSTPTFVSWFNFSIPMWFVAILFFFNLIWFRLSFIETHVTNEHHDWKQEIKDLTKLSKIPKMKGWLTTTFLFYFAWGFFMVYYPTFLVLKFTYSQSEIGYLSGYFSIFWLIASLAFNRWFSCQIKSEFLVLWSLPTLATLIAITTYLPESILWYSTIPIIAICGAFIWITTQAITSNLAGKANQGKIFGITQSILALAYFLSPLTSGLIAYFGRAIPMLLSVFIFASATILAQVLRKKRCM